MSPLPEVMLVEVLQNVAQVGALWPPGATPIFHGSSVEPLEAAGLLELFAAMTVELEVHALLVAHVEGHADIVHVESHVGS